ncbi:quinon protein alcohol dehydrogenase-like superfamily [Paraphysoderma sedebokerense]|nr:quinon protein alcohol dehydrogenase-like superfamily [Paraphysoderma sedebokerense]
MVINSPQKPQNQFKMPLELHWSFGFNPSVCPHVHSLSGSNEQIILYSAAHTGIIYNIDTNTQISLQGHCNSITSAICTQDKDKRWLVTADAGSDSIIIVWDRTSAAPVKTIFDPHNGSGTVAMDISRDCKYLVTLGAGMPQTLSVWEWATDNNSPLVKYEFDDSQEDYQTFIQVNPQDPFEFVTNGAKTISFFRWSPAGVQRFKPTERGNRRSTTFTQSCFVPNTTQAVSATKEGDVVVYDCINIGNIASKQQKENKTAIKRINHLHSHAINTITTYDDKYIVTGGDDGFIRVYDLQFKLLAFLEKLQAGPISSISFNHGGIKSLFDEIYIPDIFISTKTSKILHIQRENKPNQPTITALLEAPSSPIKALATNPTTSDYVVGDDNGSLQIWDYEGKAVKSFRQFSEMGKITCAMYCREGTHIAVGFNSGFLVIVLTEDLDGNHVAKLQLSQSSILRLSFSDDSKYLAFSDGQHAVGLLQNLPSAGWSLVGKFKSHSKEITALLFNSVKATSRPPALVSISRDRTLVEYDLPASNVENGLKIRHIKGLEQSAEPLACVWVPPLKDEPDGVLIASNSEFKLRIYKESTYVCKKTVLGPTYSECLNR